MCHLTGVRDPIETLNGDLANCGINPNRLKDQNFLIAKGVRDRIVRSAALKPGEAVLEIGPGTGILTWKLLCAGAEVEAIELEETFCSHLREKFSEANRFNVHNADAMVLLQDFINDPKWSSRRLISNLPYAISSPVLITMAKNAHRINGGLILLQREVVDRVIAAPDTAQRSALSVIVQRSFQASRLMNVKPSHFNPRPKVDSAVLSLKLRDSRPDTWDPIFEKVVFAAFSHRRKTILNNFKNSQWKAVGREALERAEVDPGLRAQSLKVQDFVRLTKALNPDVH